ncbi:hypothetical protein [Endozoicomonas atrinae]|uniref:hypothetical protein n=1 Tax=Endozoicomonas atrinae TaxID=1333660 RepID=UPI000A819E85|nr:hypothetical protein [Endozoicomonas atrinae]
MSGIILSYCRASRWIPSIPADHRLVQKPATFSGSWGAENYPSSMALPEFIDRDSLDGRQ